MNGRQAYRWGAKHYLASMEVGESREDDGTYHWRGMQCIATHLRRQYAAVYRFRTKDGIRTVTRMR